MLFQCTKCSTRLKRIIKHRRSSKKGKDHLKWEYNEEEDDIPSDKYFKLTKEQFNSLSALALRQINRLLKRRKESARRDVYTREINKVLLNEFKNLS